MKHEIGRPGMKDEEILPLLHRLPSATFFTRDQHFYFYRLCHPNYCLVCLVMSQYETASFIRRFLKHSAGDRGARPERAEGRSRLGGASPYKVAPTPLLS